MNPLQEYPHLFVENFRCLYQGKQHLIIGSYSAILLEVESSDALVEGEQWVDPKDCTLIARPIESLSDGEIREVYEQPNWSQDDCEMMRDFLITRAGSGNMKLNIALKLADKGAFPFDNSHFGDTVIDTRTLTNA